MPHYEFQRGASHKFWDIVLSKDSFTTTYGKVGSNGQSSSKSFATPAEAKKAHDKLIAAKTKKGYILCKGKAAAKKKTPVAKKAKAPVAKKKTPIAKAKAPVAKKKTPVAKKTKAPTAKKTPATASPAATPGARYFEFVEGKSSKFWEVLVEGSTLTTRYGKIGTKGQSKDKGLVSAAAAKKSGDSLVAEKIKKGYREIGAVGSSSASNAKLEAAIEKNTEDLDGYAVLSDWLQEHGDPRGELIALQLNNKDKAAKKFIEKHAEHFFGELLEHRKVHDEGYNNASSSLRDKQEEKAWQKTQRQAFLWRLGYFDRVRLSHDAYSDEAFDGETVDILAAAIAHPSGRFIREFAFQSNGDPNDDNLQSLIDLLAKKAPKTTQKITFGDNIDQVSWHHTGNLAKLWKGVPGLRVLEIESGHFDVGKMVAPALERAVFITGGLSKSCGRNIAKATMPKIKHLEIYYGDTNYGGSCSLKEVKPLLDRTDLKQLEFLGLKNSMFANEIAQQLRSAKVLKTVKTLDLSCGTMTDEGAAQLVKAKKSLAHLECLDLSSNFLTKDGILAVQGLAKKVITSSQNEPDDWDEDELHYFVSVAE